MSAARRTIAVAEIGGTSVKIGFARDGAVSAYARTFPTARLRQAAPVPQLAALLREAAADAGFVCDAVVATVPGFLGRDRDTILNTANIPELNGLKLATALSRELGIPVLLERDSVLQLLGERAAGSVRDEEEILAIYLGTGIGAAYFGEGEIFRGGGWALEVGHMPAYRPDVSGRPDRVETFASGKTLADIASRHKLDIAGLFAAGGDERLQAEINDVLWHQAAAIASAIAVCSPDILLLGGGVADMAGYPRPLLEQRILECLPIMATVHPPAVRWASLGWQAAVHGAIALDRRSTTGKD